MEIDLGSTKSISIYRERKATKAERRKDRDAKIMAEWVHVTFSNDVPAVVINRDLCDD